MNRDRVGRRPFNWRLVVGRALAVLAGAVFVYAGVLKAGDPLQFANDLSNYQHHSVAGRGASRLLSSLAGNPLRPRAHFSPDFCGSAGHYQRSHAHFYRGDDLGKNSGNQRGLRLLRHGEQQPDAHLASRHQQFYPGRPDCSLVYPRTVGSGGANLEFWRADSRLERGRAGGFRHGRTGNVDPRDDRGMISRHRPDEKTLEFARRREVRLAALRIVCRGSRSHCE